MVYIPINEIKQPRLHADTLGFTFIWKGHFLRGIYPESISLAKSYFDSGFLDEVVNKGLFPRTWISDFENEQFGMIIEHEFIVPMLYAMEWNFNMLKDAALMVLDIAQIGLKYGYNMIDCHKANVCFCNNRPLYVDLGSFVPLEKGSTGWHPYSSFLRSYYYVLNVWEDGAKQIAKRTMATSLEFDAIDYTMYRYRFFRKHLKLAEKYVEFQRYLFFLASCGNEKLANKTIGKGLFTRKVVFGIKKIIGIIKPISNQNIKKIYHNISKKESPFNVISNNSRVEDKLIDLLNTFSSPLSSATIIDCEHPEVYQHILNKTSIKRIISINQSEAFSNIEYNLLKESGCGVLCTHFQILNNSIMVPGKYQYMRFYSDIVIIPHYHIRTDYFAIHNALIFLENCAMYSKSGKVLLRIYNCSDEQKELFKKCVKEITDNYYLFEKNDENNSK